MTDAEATKGITTPELTKGRYHVQIVRGKDAAAGAQALRSVAFDTDGLDRDRFDDMCDHLLVHDRQSSTLICCARLLSLAGGGEVARSYSAQYYDLSALAGFQGRMAELGRFCIHPDWSDPDILRIAWAAVTGYVDENDIEMLFGCSSFAGVEVAGYLDAFAMLRARYLAPERWRPRVKSPEVFHFCDGRAGKPDVRRALRMMPPLLRSYLTMGGWVSDHAVVDRQMNTLHVFTGLEIAAIPEPRKRLFRVAAGGI